jgi:hypothetical protein
LQIIYRWKALSEENILEQFIFGFMHCESLAFKEKELGYEVQLNNLESDRTNWRFGRRYMGPTIRLKTLLV